MKPIEFEQQTTVLGPPRGWARGECGALPVQMVEGTLQSYWKPTPEEIEALKNGGHIRLTVHSHAHPPVWVDVTPAGYAKELP